MSLEVSGKVSVDFQVIEKPRFNSLECACRMIRQFYVDLDMTKEVFHRA